MTHMNLEPIVHLITADNCAYVVLLTACNRTYYGDVGRTYELEIRRPREDRLPFLCHLNFTAAGGQLGDLVQVILLISAQLYR